jgi:hypothetical protein
MPTEVLTGPEWLEWKQYPQTKAFLLLLHQSVQETQEAWLNSEYIADDAFKSAILNEAALASAQAVSKVIYQIENAGANYE